MTKQGRVWEGSHGREIFEMCVSKEHFSFAPKCHY